MKRFKRILVGVDLSWGDRFVAEELSAPNAEAVRQALWLARLNSATVCFLSTLDLPAKAQQLIVESSTNESTILDEAENRLAELVTKARKAGVVAESHVVFGKSWVELIRSVLRKKHDLVLVGTRHNSGIRGFLVGSTGIKLLRKCPSAVWVTQPQRNKAIRSILVAHDLKPVGDLAMELGRSLAQLHDAQLHVLHSIEFPELESAFPERVSADQMTIYRAEAQEHIEAQLQDYNFAVKPMIHVVSEPPDIAILDYIDKYDVELLTMGTIARTGIAGFFTGNTAERLLPQLPCSVLAVKPSDFVSPVTL